MKKIACVFVFIGCAVVGIGYWDHSCRPMPFSSNLWKCNSHRLQMVDDLIASELLIGKSSSELHEILGGDSGGYVGSEWSQFPFSSVMLYIEIKDGKVVNVYRRNKF